jgi:ubiquinone/menaquinone biosynthesis C-methylase UbiE
MGWYSEQVVPRLVACTCGTADLVPLRRDALVGLSGEVVEIGFGSGHNLAAYPAEVSIVNAVEPSAVARRQAASRIAASAIEVRWVGLDGASIELDDASCDGAVSTFTLCTVPAVGDALAELRRVLRPGAPLHFLEHGISPDDRIAKWQHRIDPLQQRVAGGCHLTRDPIELVERAGFVVERSEHRYAKGPKPWTWFTSGVAVRA